MFTLYEQSAEFVDANSRSKELIASVLKEVNARRIGVKFQSESVLDLGTAEREIAYFIQDGFVRVDNESGPVFFHEPGDLLFWNPLAHGMICVADCRVVVDEYTRSDINSVLATDPTLQRLWDEYVQQQILLYTSIISSFFLDTPAVTPERRYAEPGAPIIIQGTTPDEVYTLLSGHAEVYLGEEKVGEVLPGEIFGAMAASSNSRRSASVIAKERCLYCALDSKNFLVLIRTHPHAVNRLIASMSRIITTQNEQLVELKKQAK